MSSWGLLEAKIIPKWRTPGNYCHYCDFCVGVGGLVVGGSALVFGGGSFFCGDWGVFALVMDVKRVMLTSPPELAHCASPPPLWQWHSMTLFGDAGTFWTISFFGGNAFIKYLQVSQMMCFKHFEVKGLRLGTMFWPFHEFWYFLVFATLGHLSLPRALKLFSVHDIHQSFVLSQDYLKWVQ